MSAPVPPPPPSGSVPPGGEPFYNRNYALYLVGSVASWTGLGVADVLLLWLVFAETQSTIAVAYVGLAEAFPPIAVGFVAGVLADRSDRRRILVLTTSLQAVLIGLVVLSYLALGFHLWLTVALVLGFETVTVLYRPPATAIVPALVPPDRLDGANALVQATTSVATTTGSAAAAVLLVVVGTEGSFGLDVAVFAVAALLLGMVGGRYDPSDRAGGERAPRSLRRDTAEVVRFLQNHPALIELTAVSVAAGFFVTMFSPFLVVYTVDDLHQPASMFGFLLAGYSAGFFVGSLGTPRVGIVGFYGRFFVLALIGSGGLLGLLVLWPSFALVFAALTALGGLLGLVVTGFFNLILRLVPSELLGRFLGVEEMLTWAVAPMGIVTGGLLTQSFGISVGFAAAAIGLMGVGGIALLSRGIRSIRYVPGSPRPP
ncbi:MAG TPA: MFS transporter [Thermoplasmata archaeon]